MINMRLDMAQGAKRMRELATRVEHDFKARVEIAPTQIIEYLCDKKGKLLHALPAAVANSVGDKATPKLDAAKKAVADNKPGHMEQVDKALRYWAYLYVDALWKSASTGLWGRVEPETEARKAAEGAGALAPSYGVAHRGGHAWHGVQKGKRKGTDPPQTQEVIEIKR